MKNNKLSILFSSHSNAYDIWHITEYFFNKYWSDCLIDVYLGANGNDKKEYCPNRWVYINNGEDKSWSTSLISYLNSIDTEYVLLLVDDTIFLNKVDNNLFMQALNFTINNNAKCLRLYPNPAPDIKIDSLYGQIDVLSEVPYITSWNNCIWQKNFLIELLKYDFNPWEFETQAGKTLESKKYHNSFFSVYMPVVDCSMFVEKGKFYPFIKELTNKEGIRFDFSNREFLSHIELKNLNKSRLRSKLSVIIPNRYKNKIRKLLGYHEL